MSEVDWSVRVGEFIGVVFGAGVGAFVSGWWKESGRRRAIRADIAAIIREEGQLAYEREKGKRLATHDDIENVLFAVRATTQATESLKARISGDEWDRQWIQSQRLRVYERCFAVLRNLQNTHRKHLALLLAKLQGLSVAPDSAVQWNDVYANLDSFYRELDEIALIGSVLLGSAARSALDGLARKRPLEGVSTPAREIEWVEREQKILQEHAALLIDAARHDLGIER